MKRKILFIFLISFFSIFFCACSKEKSNDFFYLDKGWTYAKDYMTNDYKEIDILQFSKLNALQETNRGYIYLKKEFELPEILKNKVLTLYMGNIQVAAEVYINEFYIGGIGRFPPNEFFDGSKICTYTIDSKMLHEGKNTLFIKLWVNGYGRISTTPILAPQEQLSYKIRVDHYIYSRFFLTSSYFMFDLSLLYILLYFLNKKEREYLSFALLTFFSSVYLTNICICEYPVHYYSKVTFLQFQKFFNTIIPVTTSFFEVSFIRDYLHRPRKKSTTIIRLILLISCYILSSIPKSITSLFTIQKYIYALTAIQVSYGLFFIIQEIKRKNPRIFSLFLGFSPLILALFSEIIINMIHFKIDIFIITICWQLVIISFLAILLYNFAQLNRKNEYLNENLEKLVDERTTELTYTNKLLEKTNDNLEYEKRRSEREIELASFVQQTFFKHDLPEFKNWDIAYYSKPMSGVSGDLYDFYVKNNILNGLGIFDVSGHGISSGLVTMLVKNIIQQEFYLGEKEPLSDVMSFINDRVIEEKGNIENYLTGILVRLTQENNLELVNAGHPQPIIYSATKKNINFYNNEEQNRYGVIGIADFPINFNVVHLSLEKGDEILLYTDGVTEATNNNNEAYGNERLLKSFESNLSKENLNEQIQGILSDFNSFRETNPIEDDITFIILRKK